MLWRSRGKIKTWHKGFVQQLLLAMAKAVAKNMKKAAKGEEADSTLNPLDLIPGTEGAEGTEGMEDVNLQPEDAEAFAKEFKDITTKPGAEKALTRDIMESMQPEGLGFPSEPQIVKTTRPFEEQLNLGDPGAQPIQAPRPPVPTQILQPQRAPQPQGFAPQASSLPPQIQQIVSQTPGAQTPGTQALPPTVPPGILAGLKESILNMPTTAGQIPAGRTGRQAAYATGETLGDFLRSNALRLPTADPTTPAVKVKHYDSEADIPETLGGLRRSSVAQLDDGKFKVSFGRSNILNPIEEIKAELERQGGEGLIKPEQVSDDDWFDSNDETKKRLMEIYVGQ